MPMASKSAHRPVAYHFAQVRLHRIFTDWLTIFSDTSRLITNGPAISPISNEVSAAITARSVRY
jgi:hypothetical protein